MIYLDIAKFTKEQLDYCSNKCSIGINTKKYVLNECESAADAAFDMHCFVSKCSESCEIIKKVGTDEN